MKEITGEIETIRSMSKENLMSTTLFMAERLRLLLEEVQRRIAMDVSLRKDA